MAAPLGQHCQGLPLEVKDIITKARTTWLKNDEVLKLLMHHQKYELPIGKEPPRCPGGGLLFLFNRKAVRFFRKDGHEWRKKTDGKTVRETHEKLKIGNKEVLNCYYAHSEAQEALQPSVHSSMPSLAALAHQTEDASQQGLDFSAQGSGRVYGASGIDRASSTPAESSDAGMLASTMTSAKSLDRQNSLGPLHTAPSFSAGTVQTGSTLEGPLCSSEAVQWQQGAPAQPNLLSIGASGRTASDSIGQSSRQHRRTPSNGSQDSGRSCSLPPSQLDLRHVQSEQEAHARAWEALKRKEREAAEATDDTLKPAASLTRVDSDTLKVAPSLSGATGGFNLDVSRHPIPSGKAHKTMSAGGVRYSVASPFFAAAYVNQEAKVKPQNLVEEVLEHQVRSSSMSWKSTGTPWNGVFMSASLQTPADYDSLNTERIKRYRSGDVTGSNHSYAPSAEGTDLSNIPDVTSPSTMQRQPGNLPYHMPGRILSTLPGADLSQELLAAPPLGPISSCRQTLNPQSVAGRKSLPAKEMQPNPANLLGGIEGHQSQGISFGRDGMNRWQTHQIPESLQTERLTKDLDMLLPMDLDWAMNLSNCETEDFRKCRAL